MKNLFLLAILFQIALHKDRKEVTVIDPIEEEKVELADLSGTKLSSDLDETIKL